MKIVTLYALGAVMSIESLQFCGMHFSFVISHLSFLISHPERSDLSGGYCGGVPPLPIPNREVKPACADGTAMQCGRVGGRHFFKKPQGKEKSPVIHTIAGLFWYVLYHINEVKKRKVFVSSLRKEYLCSILLAIAIQKDLR